VLKGALSWAVDGSVIGEGVGVGELVGVGIGVAVGDPVGVGDVAAFGWVVHAVRTRTRRRSARMRLGSHDLVGAASDLADQTLTIAVCPGGSLLSMTAGASTTVVSLTRSADSPTSS
jgi:hypothetical protein